MDTRVVYVRLKERKMTTLGRSLLTECIRGKYEEGGDYNTPTYNNVVESPHEGRSSLFSPSARG